jgi:hypothetical protein
MAKPDTRADLADIENDPTRKRQYVWNRKEQLWTDRASWDAQAKEMAQFLLPRASRFTTSETNSGQAKHNKIYDNTALRAVRTLAAGMMSGMTSPARPWFKLKHADDELMAYEPVKVWCAEVTKKILQAFARSNVYRALHQQYTELGVFGTHAAIILPHEDRLLHATSLTWGEYALALDKDARPDTLYRQMRMTSQMMVQEFGYEACSDAVQTAYRRGSFDRFEVIHAIEPRLDRDPWKLDKRNMPWRSCYFEQTQKNAPGDRGDNGYLREGGFRRFRALAPRWQVTGLDTYGESPGMEAIGDAKQLQHEQFRKAQGIDYQTRPPVGLPSAMKGQEVDMLPGGVTYFDSATGAMGQRQLFEARLDLQHLLLDIQDVRGRINSAFYADLFLMIASMEQGGDKMTATEVAERHEEKLLMLGPVLERLTDETCSPVVDMAFEQLMETGQLPPPPPELENQPLETELIGILAQAQKAVQTGGIDRFFSGVATIGSLGKPEVADKIDGDRAVEVYADSLGVDPTLLLDDDKVAAIRKQRAQAQQQAQQAAAASEQADRVSKLGGVSTQGGASNMAADALGPVDPINMFSGYGSPQAERLP